MNIKEIVGKIRNSKIGMAALISVLVITSVTGGVIYFHAHTGTAIVKTGTQSYEQQVFFNTTNANVSGEPLQIMNSSGDFVSVNSSSSLMLVNMSTAGHSWAFNVKNLTQGDYVIMTVGIKNTGTGNLPFANYSQLNITESGTGPFSENGSTTFTNWTANTSTHILWNPQIANNEGAVAGYFPTSSIMNVLNTNQSSITNNSNQTFVVIVSGPQSGYGSGTIPITDYPTFITPGQEVYYNVIFGLGTYAPVNYLNQTYTFNFTVGAE